MKVTKNTSGVMTNERCDKCKKVKLPLYFDRSRKNWNCRECTNYLKTNDKPHKKK